MSVAPGVQRAANQRRPKDHRSRDLVHFANEGSWKFHCGFLLPLIFVKSSIIRSVGETWAQRHSGGRERGERHNDATYRMLCDVLDAS